MREGANRDPELRGCSVCRAADYRLLISQSSLSERPAIQLLTSHNQSQLRFLGVVNREANLPAGSGDFYVRCRRCTIAVAAAQSRRPLSPQRELTPRLCRGWTLRWSSARATDRFHAAQDTSASARAVSLITGCEAPWEFIHVESHVS